MFNKQPYKYYIINSRWTVCIHTNQQDFPQYTNQIKAIVIPKSKGFKGIGFKGSTELETTLKPGLILKRTGKVGNTVLGKGAGQRVPIITAKVVKAPKKVSTIFRKATTGKKLTSKEKTLLKKATGFEASEISRSFIPKRRISPSALVAQIARIRSGRKTPVARVRPRPSPRRPIPRGPKRPPTRPPVRPVARPPIRAIRLPPVVPVTIKEAIRRIRKKKKRAFKSDIALVEGFTAKALGLKHVKITKANLARKVKQFQTIGTRRRPVFVRAKPKTKLVRRRKKR